VRACAQLHRWARRQTRPTVPYRTVPYAPTDAHNLLVRTVRRFSTQKARETTSFSIASDRPPLSRSSQLTPPPPPPKRQDLVFLRFVVVAFVCWTFLTFFDLSCLDLDFNFIFFLFFVTSIINHLLVSVRHRLDDYYLLPWDVNCRERP
jgi:hypothetical protein